MHKYLVLYFFFLSVTCWSQSITTNLVLQSGINVPVFEYAAKNLDNGSFAQTGFTASCELNTQLNQNWGVYLQSGINFNPVDVGSLGYEKVQEDPFLLDVYIRSDPYKIIHLLTGPSYIIQISNRLMLQGQLGAGVFFSSTPYQLYKPEYFLMGPPFFEITPSKDISFAYSGSFRIIYEISTCYQIGLSSQFMHSKASFDFYNGTNIRTDIRNISCWNTSLTLILRLHTSIK